MRDVTGFGSSKTQVGLGQSSQHFVNADIAGHPQGLGCPQGAAPYFCL